MNADFQEFLLSKLQLKEKGNIKKYSNGVRAQSAFTPDAWRLTV